MDAVFVKSCVDVFSRRMRLLAVLNLTFFGGVFVSALVSEFLFPPPLYLGPPQVLGVPDFFLWGGVLTVFGIFLFNLLGSSLLIVTLPGVALFPLSTVALVYRAVLWGMFVYATPASFVILILPTILAEGEAYVFAAAAGTIVGVSWTRPKWAYSDSVTSRRESFGRGLKESGRLYVFVVVMLFVGAVVEWITIAML